MAQTSFTFRTRSPLLPGLALVALFVTAPLRAENLHALWHGDGSSAVVDHLLTSLAEDQRSNRLFLSTSPEQLRAFLLQRLCLDAAAGCVTQPGAMNDVLQLRPADIELLLQHLNSSLQVRQLPLHQQQRLLEQLSLDSLQHGQGTQPLASL